MHRITLLDSLRGIAALIVVFHHYFSHFTSVFRPLQQQPWLFQLLSFVSNLNVEAVLFFFVLSGFCIQLSIQKLDFTRRSDINHYLYKRFRRILPIYFVGLLFTFLLGALSQDYHQASYSFKNLLGNLLFLQTSKGVGAYWFIPYGDNGPLWSLSYEMFFYLFFPWYHLLVIKVKSLLPKQWGIYELGLLVSLLSSLAGIASKQLLFNPFSAFLSYFFVWFSGIYLARVFQQKRYADGVVAIYCLTMAVLTVTVIFFPSDTLRNLIAGGCIFLMCYAFYRFRALRSNIIFSTLEGVANQTFYFIGIGSYALYILHFPVLTFFEGESAQWAFLAVLLLIPVCILMEEKLVRLKYRFLEIEYIPASLIETKSK